MIHLSIFGIAAYACICAWSIKDISPKISLVLAVMGLLSMSYVAFVEVKGRR